MERWGGKVFCTQGLRQISDCLLVHNIVEDQGGVDAWYNMAVYLLRPLYRRCGTELEVFQVELEQCDHVGYVVNNHPDARCT